MAVLAARDRAGPNCPQMARRAKTTPNDHSDAPHDQLAIHVVDLLGQVESLMREVTDLQRQAIRLREPGNSKAQSLTRIRMQMKAIVAHVETFHEFVTDTQQAVDILTDGEE
jgi:phage host-nuclease inhibitor protein Gam